MSRRVRHIHASSDEYIAVHRSHGRHYSSTSNGEDLEGCFGCIGYVCMGIFALLIVGLIMSFIINFWHIILSIILIAVAVFLLIKFRKQVWNGIKNIYTYIRKYHNSKRILQTASSVNTKSHVQNHDPNYGKIIQKRKK